MAFYEVSGTDSKGNAVLLGTAEKAGIAFGQYRAAERSMPVHSLIVRVDSVAIDISELERRLVEDPHA